MRDIPILFSSKMVRAILDDLKASTRRVIPNQDYLWQMDKSAAYGPVVVRKGTEPGMYFWDCRPGTGGTIFSAKCPYLPGDSLWVRESLCVEIGATKSDIECGKFTYKADDEQNLWTKENGYKTIPSIHMPRFASRITLDVTNSYPQRIQEINGDECMLEGIRVAWSDPNSSWQEKLAFKALWDSINAKRGFGWDVNCWVWAVAFHRRHLTQRATDSGDSPASKPVSSDGGAYCEHGDKAVIDKNTALCVWCGKPPRLPDWVRDELSQLPRRR